MRGIQVTTLHAKPIIADKFWIVEKDGEKFATLRNNDGKFVLSSTNGMQIFDSKERIVQAFGPDFFVLNVAINSESTSKNYEVHGYPTRTVPVNPMFDVQRRLPLFYKSESAKSLYCAGYYIIHFEKGWLRAFCPKLLTLQQNEYQGPFKTKDDMKKVLKDVNRKH